MRFRKHKVQFKYQGEADVLILQSEAEAPLLRKALSSSRCSELHIGKPYFIFRPRYIFWFLRYWCLTSKSVANVCAHIRSHRLRTVVGMDYLDCALDNRVPPRPLITECSKFLRNVNFFTVQHGWQWDTRPTSRAVRNLTLLTFGTQSANQFPDYGREECQFVPVGSLSLSHYQSIRPKQIHKRYTICLVSSIRNAKFFEIPDERALAFAAMVNLFEHYPMGRKLKVIVAVNNRGRKSDAEAERAWFANKMGPEIVFSGRSQEFGDFSSFDYGLDLEETQSLNYSTYYASDMSDVTIGGTSTVLWESFARGNKTLAVNMTNSGNFDFPEEGIWAMRNPSPAEFEDRLNDIIEIDIERWLAISSAARERIIMSDSHTTTAERLASVIQRASAAI